MFAGAAREAVFSRAENVRRINAEFVPVALKAGLVYAPFAGGIPPADAEQRLYRELARSMPAPQGIGVVNSAGKALDWVMTFADDGSVLAFLDHARDQFARLPDASRPVPTERYMRFPSQKLADAKDSGQAMRIADRHPAGETCPGTPPLPSGALDARLYGRALDEDGKPVADTVPQENYVEDRFTIPPPMLERLTKALAAAGSARFRIDDDLARLLVSHAYLGQLDLNPAQGTPPQCELWGQAEPGAGDSGPAKRAGRRDPILPAAGFPAVNGAGRRDPLPPASASVAANRAGEANPSIRIRIEGRSDAAAESARGGQRARIDGAFWRHDVKLAWRGVIETRKDRVTRLLLVGSGSETLQWNNGLLSLPKKADVTSLPAGHAIDLACAVRYGIFAEAP